MARILLTGASSFTGLWIAEALAGAGHEVTATLTRGESDYPGLRGERVARLAASATRVFEAPLDSDRFRDLARTGRFDLFAQHGADIPGYRSPDYDVAAGVARNLAGAEAAVRAAAQGGCRALVSTATVFEPGKGEGVRWNDPAFGIAWPAEPRVISPRDAAYPDFSAA